MTVFSDNIKFFRKKNNMSQVELAEKLYLTPQAISKWECGISEPDLKFLCKLAKVFNVTTDELLGISGKMSDELMIGIDGGGTKTEFILFSQAGEIMGHKILGGSNPNMYGIENAFSMLKKGIDSFLLSHAGNISGIYGGIAGCGSGDNAEKLIRKLKKEYENINIKVTSDIENVIGSVENITDCIAVICGTGSIVYAKRNEEYHRLGGWGYLFDEAGSGFTIGRDAICASLAEKDGTGEKTILTELIEEKLEGKVWDKINVIYSKGSEYIASFSGEVFAAYSKQDKVAEKILDRNFSRVAELINHSYRKYKCDGNVILSGGITKSREIVGRFLESKVDSGISLIFPDMPQIYGACRNCLNTFSKMEDDFGVNFRNGYLKTVKVGKNNAKN